MCAINERENMHTTEPYYASVDGGILLPNNSTTDVLVSLGLTLNFVYHWIQCFESNYTSIIAFYKEKLESCSIQIPSLLEGRHR